MKTSEEKNRLLLIDDDTEFCQLVRDYMELQAIALDWRTTAAEGLASAETGRYDLILLDMMLPDLHGVEVLRQLRMKTGVPVIIFSAYNDETDRIVTLELGADDYVPKSFSSRELLARIRAVLRRTLGTAEGRNGILSVRGLELDPFKLKAAFNGRTVELTHVEFQLLYAMMKEPGRVFSRESLLNLFATDKEWSKFDRSVDVHISSLRKKLFDATGSSELIRTVRSIGYMFVRQEKAAIL